MDTSESAIFHGLEMSRKSWAYHMEGNYKPFEAIFKDHLKERSIEAREKDGRQDKDVIAVQAIQKNRDSLDRMERSYPETAQKTHAEISTARATSPQF
ncbi:hypothetical protein ACCP96_22350 (plasmid) [Xanthomonas campestris pv. fici]|uniref:hypothetical protein n=1 Tax=Xanthomonas euvesicatoria TaxID=456327 RepID=UPI003558AE90